MSDNRKVSVAAIGAGGWGRNVVRTLALSDRFSLKAVCDLDPDRLADCRRRHPDVLTTDKLEEALSADVEAAAVAVDAPRHHEVAAACLDAGKHVFVEKPLALSEADALDLVDRAEHADRRLMVGHLMLYHPAVIKIKEVIDSGELGEILYVYCQRVNLGVVRQAENAWWSLAPHDVSIALFLLGGAPVSVSASGQCFLQPKIGVEDVVFASVKFDDGTLAHIHVSWLDPHKERKLTVVGTRKMAVFDDTEPTEKLRIYDKGAELPAEGAAFTPAVRLRSGDILIPELPRAEPLRVELDHFANAVATGAPIRSDGHNGLDVVRVLAAGSESLRRGGALVPLPGA